jgi:antitoxin (DNA-binding transcriptional repressor) of toxin-antitoxin stability system
MATSPRYYPDSGKSQILSLLDAVARWRGIEITKHGRTVA